MQKVLHIYMKKIHVVTVCLLFFSSLLNAAVLRELQVEGLDKTRISTVKGIIGYDIGDQIDKAGKEDIRQNLLKSGLFINETIKVDLTTSGDDAYLRISLHDRITLLPIPIASVSDGSYSGGLFVMDRNFLGLGHQLFAGGMISSDDRMFMLGYTNPSLKRSAFQVGGSMSAFMADETVTDISGKDDLAAYEYQTVGGGISAGWESRFLRLGLQSRVYFLDVSFSDQDAFVFHPEVSAEYSSFYYDRYFDKGMKASLSYGIDSYTDVFDFTQTAEAEVSYHHLLHPRWQIQLNGDMGISEGDPLQSLSLGQGACGSILPDTVLADWFMQGNLKLMYAALDFSWGYIAVPLAYQVGVLDGMSGDNALYHGPSGGVSLYLKRVAIPAMSIQYASNLETGKGLFSFSIGMEM